MPAHSEQPEVDISKAVWYLGIDFGTTGVSAVLLNHSTAQQYPIYWSNNLGITQEELRNVQSNFATRSSGKILFRLPAVAYSDPNTNQFVQLPVAPNIVGSLASAQTTNQPGIFLQNFKPYLSLGLPYYCPNRREWEPTLNLHSQQQVSLYWVRQALQALLATLKPKRGSADSEIHVGAIGLERETLERAMQELEGVVLSCPAGWGDTYRFNLREALLEAELVRYPEQVFFLEDAIATILACLPLSNADAPKTEREAHRHTGTQGADLKNTSGLRPATLTPPRFLTSWRGGILVINAGATTTELALVDLPDNLQDLTHSDFSLCSLPYAGNAIDQDIFCQLLYPQMTEEQHQQLSLKGDVELPLPGQPDQQRRDRLASVLQSSPFGQALLKAAGYLKLILQHKDEFTLQLGPDQWVVKRLDLEASIISPLIQQLNRELNALLVKTGIPEQGIHHVFCIGGTAGLGTLQKWLQQRLPLATLIHDTDSPTGSWVAAGLATLSVYPQVLNQSQQQYSDYFLLLELLRTFAPTALHSADRSYSLEEIRQHLEYRGLNTGACYERLVRLVEGQLPPGLVPSITDSNWLSHTSKQNLYYSILTAESLFSQEDNQLYRPNLEQQERLRDYLNMVLSGTYQKFEEPLIVNFGA